MSSQQISAARGADSMDTVPAGVLGWQSTKPEPPSLDLRDALQAARRGSAGAARLREAREVAANALAALRMHRQGLVSTPRLLDYLEECARAIAEA